MYRKIVLAALAVICCQLGVKAEELSPRQMKSILVAANAWSGTPYRFAGKDRGGIDCSHFVHAAYSRVLPDYKYRMAEDYLNDPQFSQTTDPQPGDIILFTAVNRMSAHVGIVTDPEERKFIGSQSSTGVKETSYAAKTYWGKRPYRFLSLNARSRSVAWGESPAIANRPKGHAGGVRVASPGANRGHDQDLRSPISKDRVKVKDSRTESLVSRRDAKSPPPIAISDYTGQTFNVLPLDRE